MLKLDGSRNMTGGLAFTGTSKNITWASDGGGNIGAPGANRPNYLYVKDTGYFGGFLQVGLSLSWASDGSGDIGSSTNFRPNNIYVKTGIVNGIGAAATPSYSFTGATNTGMYFATGALRIGVAGSERITASPISVQVSNVPFQVNAGFRMARAAVTASGNIMSNAGSIFGVTSLSAPRVLTLPTGMGAGHIFYVKDETGLASVSNYIRIQAPTGVTIDGQEYYDIVVPYESIKVYFNGTNWFII
jgi:hypothetical protein